MVAPDGRVRPRGSLPKTPSGKLRRLAIGRALTADDGLLARVDFG